MENHPYSKIHSAHASEAFLFMGWEPDLGLLYFSRFIQHPEHFFFHDCLSEVIGLTHPF
jgi:hypothetical protein